MLICCESYGHFWDFFNQFFIQILICIIPKFEEEVTQLRIVISNFLSTTIPSVPLCNSSLDLTYGHAKINQFLVSELYLYYFVKILNRKDVSAFQS